MKNALKSAICLLILSGIMVSKGQAFERVVLFELFTSSTCPPCATWVPIIDGFLSSTGSDNVVEIAYHMNWPGAGNDPFYLNNPADNTARRTYYGINAVPNLMADGVLGTSASGYASYYNQRHGIPAPVDIDLNITVGAEINLTAEITAENYFSGNGLKFRSALICIEYDIPGGGWTYTHFEWGMLDMEPSAYGINFNISPGETVTLNSSYPIPIYPPTGLDNLAIVAFVQNDASHEVLQAKHAQIPLDFPSLSLVDFTVEDPPPGGNGNGLPEPGETCELWVELQNGEIFAPATGITGVLSTEDPGITFTTNQASFPDINSGGTGTNEDNPFVFEVDPVFAAHNVEFRLDITANGGAYTSFQTFSFMVGIPPILLVDDDGGAAYETWYMESLDDLNEAYDVWEVQSAGVPSGSLLSNYGIVIWYTGMETAPIDANEQSALTYYCDHGGQLFISSENMGDDIGGSAFYSDYMHAQHESDHISTLTLDGVAGDPITSGTNIIIIGGAFWPESQSSIIPDAEAFPIFLYTNPAQSCGALRYSGIYDLVYLAYPFECISPGAVGYTHIEEVMEDILNWFDSLGSDLTITLTPVNPPIQIPANGGSFDFNIEGTNSGATAETFDIWTMATLPNGSEYGPIINVSDFTLAAGASIERDRTQAVPANAPAGGYTYDAYLGDYPNIILAEGHFDFEKLETADGGEAIWDWENSGEIFESQGVVVSESPNAFVLLTAYPNPFNPTTALSYQLTADSYIELVVYDVMGREAAVLVDDFQSAGMYEVTFDGSDLGSGVYFARIITGNLKKTMKLLLTK